MPRNSNVLPLLIASCVAVGWSISLSAQSPHGISRNKFLSSEKSTKSMNLQELNLTVNSTQRDNKGAVSGLTDQGGKTLGRLNELAPKSSQAGTGQLQALRNNGPKNRRVGEENWGTAFEGIKTKPGPSKGKLPAEASTLQSRSSTKGLLTDGGMHGVTGDGWSRLQKNTEGLK